MRVKTMRGVEIDMTRIMLMNEKAHAVGNAQMNARGDIMGLGGVIIKSREQTSQEYHQTNPKAVKQVALKDLIEEVFQSPAEALATVRAATSTPVPEAQSSAPVVSTQTAVSTPKKKITDSDS